MEPKSHRMRNHCRTFLSALTIAILAAGAATARIRAGDTSVIALDRVLSPAIQPLTVTSPAAEPGKPFPPIYTASGKNISPEVSWDGAPVGVQSYALIMEDTDSRSARPTVHWLAYNIPGSFKGLGRNVRNRPKPKEASGLEQGVNYAGGIGYLGPRPLAGDPPHHYHIEVFALRQRLRLRPGANIDTVIAAMNDNVLADGEAVGTFASPGTAQENDEP